MNTVQPIRDIDIVFDIADYLKKENERNYVMFMFGIYSGLRISDILKFRVRDIRDIRNKTQIKEHFSLREMKTNKEKRFAVNPELKPILKDYIADKEDYMYLFLSTHGNNKPITRQQAYNILSDAGKHFGLEAIGTHTLRKTWGYHTYQQSGDPVTIMEILNHSNIEITLRYIGINQDNKDKVMTKLSFKR
ncbi:MAG TPA: site-specific integrase [Lachnoclostridium phytofermentans]|uniref:Site-specific integrase n=1 Tax=Lachnoclostridium phytofermentans TaxID=66219 RepID=A0A3D2X6W4_9FIRM|nr:site-specific integrase [Lachnoclostridium phytofermentans]